MKQRILRLLPIFVLLIMAGTSCKKCHVCTVLDENNNAVYNYLEVCGTNGDLEAYKKRCEAEYGVFDFTCSCGPRE